MDETKIDEEIKNALDAISEKMSRKKNWEDKAWTKEISEKMVELGNGYKFMSCTCTPSLNTEYSGWLYDICWLSYDRPDYSENANLKRFVLALESEWSGSPLEVYNDFQKILLANAEIKCMIFQCPNEEKWQKHIDRMVQYINQFDGVNRGELYILSGWCKDHGKFRHQTIKIRTAAGL